MFVPIDVQLLIGCDYQILIVDLLCRLMISHEINALIFIFDVVIFMLRKLIVISVVLNLQ